MPLLLKDIVPWGRSFEEYCAMFHLTNEDLNKKIIGVGDGPASFNRTMHDKGHTITSCDPVYQFTHDEIKQRITETKDTIRRQIVDLKDNYIWNTIKTPDQLCEIRLNAMNIFLNDFEAGKAEGRYRNHSLPSLPFSSDEFELALCSHFLFTYEDRLDYNFHLSSLKELVRIAGEARIFPLVTLNSERSAYLDALYGDLTDNQYTVEIITVDYEFQTNGNQMLKITK